MGVHQFLDRVGDGPLPDPLDLLRRLLDDHGVDADRVAPAPPGLGDMGDRQSQGAGGSSGIHVRADPLHGKRKKGFTHVRSVEYR